MAGLKHRGRWALLTSVVILAGMLLGFTNQSGATGLSDSNFEGSDGNLVVTNSGARDWASLTSTQATPPGILNTGIDDESGSSDNSFGKGTKEDNAAVTVVQGSIPPNKSDLTKFYEASEHSGSDDFLYLAWERSNVLGSANMDFEINQNVTTVGTGTPPLTFDGTVLGPVTLNRTQGDLLITYDFGGSGDPSLHLLTWETADVTKCFSANSVPCWGNRVDLGTNAVGAVNTTTLTDLDGTTSLPANTFGEAKIDLTTAGIFPAGICKAFGSAFLKSRSSSSFPAEVKDFIAPIPVKITNCGSVKINKHSDSGAALTDARFVLFNNTTPISSDTFKDPRSSAAASGVTANLTTTIASGSTSFSAGTIAGGSVPDSGSFTAQIGTEKIRISGATVAGGVATMTIAARGVDGTTAVDHAVNDAVTLLSNGEDAITRTTDAGGTLSAAVSQTAVSLSFSSTTGFPAVGANSYVAVDNEIMKVTAKTSTSLAVSRGQEGSTASTHKSGSSVKPIFTCTPTGATNPTSCTLTALPFGSYWAVETTVPTGYNGGDPTAFAIDGDSATATPADAEITVENHRASFTLNVHKKDEGTTAIPICDSSVTEPCASFNLYTVAYTGAEADLATTAWTTTAPAAGDTIAITNATATAFPTSDFYILFGDTTNEIVRVHPDSGALKVGARGAAGTSSKAHTVGTRIKALTEPPTSGAGVGSCGGADIANGNCSFTSVFPDLYWIVETHTPAGYGTASNSPQFVNLPIGGGTSTSRDFTFHNPHLYKVIVIVCSEATGKYHQSSVTFDGTTTSSLAELSSNTTQDSVCGMTSGAVFQHKVAGTYGSGSVTIS